MNSTNATCTVRSMYDRVARWRAKMSAPSVVQLTSGDTPSSLSSCSNLNSKKSAATRTSERQKKKARQEEVLKLFMPAWLEHDKTISTLCKHPHLSSTNFAQDKFLEKVDKTYHEQRCKVAFKEVQCVIKANRSSNTGVLQPKKGARICANKGRKVTLDGDPDIKTKKDAIAIIQVLLPKLSFGSPKVTLTSFKNLKV